MVVIWCHCSPVLRSIAQAGSGFSDHIHLLTIRAYISIIGIGGLDRQEALNPFGNPYERTENRAYFRAEIRSENRTLFRTVLGVILLVLRGSYLSHVSRCPIRKYSHHHSQRGFSVASGG